MLNGFSTIIFNLHRMNLDVETWEKGDNAESFDNKLTDISEKIKVLMDGNTDNDKEPRKELNKMLTEEFINGFLNSFNSLNFKQQIDFKNLIKNVLKSHKEESRFDSKYKGLLILAQNLQIDIDGPNKEPLTELRNFIDNLEDTPSIKVFKPYFKSVCSDFKKALKNPEYSKDDLNILINLYIEYFSDFVKSIDKFVIRDENGDFELDGDGEIDVDGEVIDEFMDKFLTSYKEKHLYSEEKREDLDDILENILSDESYIW